ncbi:predicted protein [Streptomyces viridochromogenes DSM 40736]|uniref:Predicted protein n=1 Tax=Streptomyces viridochromogenes (strain DSM 40736 / JCM 4977 / BCRC 1201 / Tue 494) TaxID=591159 RepID=D9XDG6_STRVT|nr:predicted protein [Streptomyces viridochromogenes DSM 40736]
MLPDVVLDRRLRGVALRSPCRSSTHGESRRADELRRGKPWGLPLEGRALLVAGWRTDVTLRRLALLLGISKSGGLGVTVVPAAVSGARPTVRFGPPRHGAATIELTAMTRSAPGALAERLTELATRLTATRGPARPGSASTATCCREQSASLSEPRRG